MFLSPSCLLLSPLVCLERPFRVCVCFCLLLVSFRLPGTRPFRMSVFVSFLFPSVSFRLRGTAVSCPGLFLSPSCFLLSLSVYLARPFRVCVCFCLLLVSFCFLPSARNGRFVSVSVFVSFLSPSVCLAQPFCVCLFLYPSCFLLSPSVCLAR